MVAAKARGAVTRRSRSKGVPANAPQNGEKSVETNSSSPRGSFSSQAVKFATVSVKGH